MSMSDRPHAPLLTWGESDGGLPTLWARVAALGWVPDARQVVVQVGRQPTTDVMETVSSLAHLLRSRAAETRVEGLDAESVPAPPSQPALADDAPICVTAIDSDELAVPRWWFDDCAVVTVVGPVACPRVGMAVVLDAQAGSLMRLGNRAPASVLAYEAHRLAPSDLAVACGRGRDGTRWWAVSPNDVAVEQAVASAAGVTATHLPALRAIARHELLPTTDTLGTPLPVIDLHPAPAWLLSLRAAYERTLTAARRARRDAATVRRNLKKVPGYVRRKLVARARRRA